MARFGYLITHELHHRQVSPTVLLEHLAAGLPVVPTPIRDVVRSYGGRGPVLIGDTVSVFEKAIAFALNVRHDTDGKAVDERLPEQFRD